MFRSMLSALVIAGFAGFAGLPFVAGCDRELEHEREIKVKDDGTVKKEERTVTESPSGTVTEKKTKTVDRP